MIVARNNIPVLDTMTGGRMMAKNILILSTVVYTRKTENNVLVGTRMLASRPPSSVANVWKIIKI